ncbi:hypothetical protein NL676_005929 [Syzygium grande]|nr:hypothetical protein NL676_005929 [Syzygium grande]
MFCCWHSPSSGALVFWLSVLVEWISHARIVRPSINNVVASLMRTVMYAVHIAVAYMAMLAIMSFNAGVLIAAVAGHAGGFLLFGSRAVAQNVLSIFTENVLSNVEEQEKIDLEMHLSHSQKNYEKST